MAGQAINWLGGQTKDLLFGGMDRGQIIGRLAPDILFGGIAAASTPGDIGDKVIAGTTQAIGGGLGGLATGRLVGKLGAGEGLQTAADFAGSFGGDFAGMAVGDNLQRGKDLLSGGKGQTAWERMSEEQQSAYAQELEMQILTKYGLIPGAQEQYLNY